MFLIKAFLFTLNFNILFKQNVYYINTNWDDNESVR